MSMQSPDSVDRCREPPSRTSKPGCRPSCAPSKSALEAWVPADAPAGLGEAMRYGVLDGGKRLRPLLVLAACQAVDGAREAALRAAVSVELIHAYSLIHDDMPCMDNDVLRRGKPTVHVRYGQAQAMLAGDAMQALAFEVLTPDDGVEPALQARLCALAGALGRPCRHGRRAGHRPGQHRQAAGRACAARHAPAQDRRAAAGQRADGRGLRPHRRRRPGRRCPTMARPRPGLPGGGRHPRRDAGIAHAGQDRRQGPGRQQADLRVGARPGGGAPPGAGLARPGAGGAARQRPGRTRRRCRCWPTWWSNAKADR